MSSRFLLNINLNERKYANPKRFWKEINYIAKRDGVSPNSIQIDDVTFGYEPVAFVKGQYAGYLDHSFYREMEDGIKEEDVNAEYDAWDEYKSKL